MYVGAQRREKSQYSITQLDNTFHCRPGKPRYREGIRAYEVASVNSGQAKLVPNSEIFEIVDHRFTDMSAKPEIGIVPFRQRAVVRSAKQHGHPFAQIYGIRCSNEEVPTAA